MDCNGGNEISATHPTTVMDDVPPTFASDIASKEDIAINLLVANDKFYGGNNSSFVDHHEKNCDYVTLVSCG